MAIGVRRFKVSRSPLQTKRHGVQLKDLVKADLSLPDRQPIFHR
jgi:hypothetical protein